MGACHPTSAPDAGLLPHHLAFPRLLLQSRNSATGHLLQLFRVSIPLRGDLCCGAIDVRRTMHGDEFGEKAKSKSATATTKSDQI